MSQARAPRQSHSAKSTSLCTIEPWLWFLRGWASAQQGEFQKGIAEIQEGLKIERATGALLYESYILGLLADACIKNDRYEQALEVLNQARLRLDEKNSERFYAAEIYRLLKLKPLPNVC